MPSCSVISSMKDHIGRLESEMSLKLKIEISLKEKMKLKKKTN